MEGGGAGEGGGYAVVGKPALGFAAVEPPTTGAEVGGFLVFRRAFGAGGGFGAADTVEKVGHGSFSVESPRWEGIAESDSLDAGSSCLPSLKVVGETELPASSWGDGGDGMVGKYSLEFFGPGSDFSRPFLTRLLSAFRSWPFWNVTPSSRSAASTWVPLSPGAALTAFITAACILTSFACLREPSPVRVSLRCCGL
jgi:hypothetical protein